MTAAAEAAREQNRGPGGKFGVQPATESDTELPSGPRASLQISRSELADPDDREGLENVAAALERSGVDGHVVCEVHMFATDMEFDVNDSELGQFRVLSSLDGRLVAVSHPETGTEQIRTSRDGGLTQEHQEVVGVYSRVRGAVHAQVAVRDAVQGVVGPDVQAELTGDGIEVTSPRGSFAIEPDAYNRHSDGEATLHTDDGRQIEASYSAQHEDVALTYDDQPLGHRRTGEVLAELDEIAGRRDTLMNTFRKTGAPSR